MRRVFFRALFLWRRENKVIIEANSAFFFAYPAITL
jgi:hypothetical protein